MGHSAKKTPWALLSIPLLLSFLPWVALLIFARPQNGEGALFLIVFTSLIAFAIVGPLTGLALSIVMRGQRISFARFSIVVFAVALPLLAFQISMYGASAATLFFRLGSVGAINMGYAALLSTGFYFVVAMVLYPFARRSTWATALAAFALAGATSLILWNQLFHPIAQASLPFPRL